MTYVPTNGAIVNAFSLFPGDQTTIDTSSDLPTSDERSLNNRILVINVNANMTDPVNSQSLTPQNYYWNQHYNLWIPLGSGGGGGSVEVVKVSFTTSDWELDAFTSSGYIFEISEADHGQGINAAVIGIVNSDISPTGYPSFFNAENLGITYDGSGNIQLYINSVPDLRFNGYALIV